MTSNPATCVPKSSYLDWNWAAPQTWYVYSILIIMLCLQPDTCLKFSFASPHMAALFDAQEWRNSMKYNQGMYRMYTHQYLIVKYAINAQSLRNITSFTDPYEWCPFYANGDFQTMKNQKRFALQMSKSNVSNSHNHSYSGNTGDPWNKIKWVSF